MLQQTQVSTVIPYFQRFMQSFPTVKALALANIDDVLSHWSGLGYYARARNCHKAAKKIHTEWRGRFPKDRETLETLPGVGRSTAAAVLSLTHNQPEAILDGNVKRVLCRYYDIDSQPGSKEYTQTLWPIAEKNTPKLHAANFNQAMMDLGATCCTRSKPNCIACPLQQSCQAYHNETVLQRPLKRKRIQRKKQYHHLLCVMTEDAICLRKRDNDGLWGGLWHPPELNEQCQPAECLSALSSALSDKENCIKAVKQFKHVLTHLDIMTKVSVLHCDKKYRCKKPWQWIPIDELKKKGISRLLSKAMTALGHQS